MKEKEQILKEAEAFAFVKMEFFDTGHDRSHIERVRKLAKYINDIERYADPFLLDLTAILHDVADSKFKGDDGENQYYAIDEFLTGAGLSSMKMQIIEVISNVSFSAKKRSGNLKDPVLLILQDADRLDAMGAVGIARAFNYGGFRGNPIYDENEKNKSTIQHFHEKLLKLKDLINTETGKKLAEDRHAFLEKFLEQFRRELKIEN
jgi:uncharacterized protein